MALTRDEKTQQIEKIGENINQSKAVVFAEYRGINMKDNQNLRSILRQSGIDFKVIKATLLKLALKKQKIEVPAEIMDKPLAVAFGYDDEVMPAKLIAESAKKIESLKIMGGLINHDYFDATRVKQLAMLPSREQLNGKLVGTLSGPMYGLVGVLNGNLRGLVSVLSQYQAIKK
ncbi:MAG: 50S ribosomal protein L10 [bacterium]|nr:50S ribosomal protein L10 [bacterium]